VISIRTRLAPLRRTPALAALAALVVPCTPGIAAACSVCMSGREDENKLAFILTTAFMTVLPLCLIGGVVLFLRRRVREIARLESNRATRPAPIAGAAPIA
jgi:hypothetical protein